MAQTFPVAAVGEEVAKRRLRQRRTWDQFLQVRRFVKDWVAPDHDGLALALASCRQDYQAWRSRSVPDKAKVTPKACWKVPWCVPCSRVKAALRVRHVTDLFTRCTPPGERPRLVHAVFTAPVYDDGTGWGMKARVHVGAFMRTVWRTLEAYYGTGLGGYLSYQDFGERPFSKPHPHVDLLLNGWRVAEPGRPVPIPRPDFAGPDRARLSECYDAAAHAFDVVAGPGNSWIGSLRVGLASARDELAYSVRQLVDLRKLVYVTPRGGGPSMRVGWQSYREEGGIDWTQSNRFASWYEEYRARVRPDAANTIHRAYGHMAPRALREAAAWGFSNEPLPHVEGCACTDCDEWEPLTSTVAAGMPEWVA